MQVYVFLAFVDIATNLVGQTAQQPQFLETCIGYFQPNVPNMETFILSNTVYKLQFFYQSHYYYRGLN